MFAVAVADSLSCAIAFAAWASAAAEGPDFSTAPFLAAFAFGAAAAFATSGALLLNVLSVAVFASATSFPVTVAGAGAVLTPGAAGVTAFTASFLKMFVSPLL